MSAYSFSDYKNKTLEALGMVKKINNDIISMKNELEEKKKKLIAIENAQAFIIKVAQETQEQLKYHINDIVQLALDSCFPGEYVFSINFEVSRGKTIAVISFVKDGYDVDPMEASGGGVVDIVSFALRIAAWALSKQNNVIILDEPFRFLSRELQPKAGLILKRLSHHLGLQIIMVTHNQDIVNSSDKVFEVSLKDNVSKVKEIENV